MARYLFEGFQRCLFHVQKFQSDAERKLAIIIDREAQKWFKPAKGQFQIFYKSGVDHLEYQPDFVAETEDRIFMLESKARNEMEASDVMAKKEAAAKWCSHATAYAQENDGKPWQYVLIPHDAITENMSLEKLAQQFVVSRSL
jgi:type III restriction enzyme